MLFFKACGDIGIEPSKDVDTDSPRPGFAGSIVSARRGFEQMLKTIDLGQRSFLLCIDPYVLGEAIEEINAQNSIEARTRKLEELWKKMKMLDAKTTRNPEDRSVRCIELSSREEIKFCLGHSGRCLAKRTPADSARPSEPHLRNLINICA